MISVNPEVRKIAEKYEGFGAVSIKLKSNNRQIMFGKAGVAWEEAGRDMDDFILVMDELEGEGMSDDSIILNLSLLFDIESTGH